ncbi:hypothetical protein [Sphingomonas sp.]|uniref:hypothetical protein n=1 Tax=Sphingomonas sp. TaxID=28214 RepID=UPI001DAB35A1|nr:hypothetical protein [Sphingomonas sp.]MBX9795738.1 hypothetical protein [Sphingomonas sp.]
MMTKVGSRVAILLPLWALASAQSAPYAQPAAPAPSVNPVLPAKTPVRVKLLSALGSKISKIDQHFPIELAEPVTVDGVALLPAGIRGEGEVVHAARARWGGKPGELILAVRFLQCGAVRVPIGRFRYAEAGKSRSGEAMAASLVLTPAVFLVAGGEVNVPAGTLADAQTVADTALPMTAGAPCPAAP